MPDLTATIKMNIQLGVLKINLTDRVYLQFLKFFMEKLIIG